MRLIESELAISMTLVRHVKEPYPVTVTSEQIAVFVAVCYRLIS